MDIPQGLRAASKAQLLDIAWQLAAENPAALAQACRAAGAKEVAESINVPKADLTVRKQGTAWVIDGEAYQVKDVLKRHGARWNGMAGAWTFTSLADAQAAIEESLPILAMRQELEAFA